MSDFHERPFDEGTLAKLEIFELYASEWLPVFLATPRPRREEIHIFDFFSGPGLDLRGAIGSPLRILRTLRRCIALRHSGWPEVRITVHFFDIDPDKIATLRSNIASRDMELQGVDIDLRPLAFNQALEENQGILREQSFAKLLLIDQCGVDQVTEEIFGNLVAYPTTDFLFFISSSTLHRFRDHPAIKLKIVRPTDYYHVHRMALEYYRELLSDRSRYYLAPFSIKKGANIYGLIFGSAHPLGMDKFLQVAWKADRLNGEADYDINRDNLQIDQMMLPSREFLPHKIGAFEQELDKNLRNGSYRNEAEIIRLCFEHGVKRQHAAPVLQKLKTEGIIELDFRVPDIKRIDSPRSIRLSERP